MPLLSAKEQQDISHAVRTVMSGAVSRELRSLSLIVQNLPATGDDSLKARLRNGREATHSDGPSTIRPTPTISRGASLFGYDYTEFLDDPEIRTPIMAYLLHMTESLITGAPFIYFMEEFWKPLQDPMFSEFALNKQKTIRKQSGLGVFVTQSPSDVLGIRSAKRWSSKA